MQKSRLDIPINATTYLGMSELIKVLSTFDKVEVVENCEFNRNKSESILLNYKGNNQEATTFTLSLVEAIGKANIAKEINIYLQWWGCDTNPLIQLEFSNEYIKEVVSIFTALKNDLNLPLTT